MDIKTFKLKMDSIDETGMFEGYAAVFGNKDLGGDVIKQGAFKRTLDATGGRIPILWQHNQTEPIGVGVDASEDGKGLRVTGQLNQDVSRGREARSLMQQGALKGLSIGYAVPQEGYHFDKDTRVLTELKLHEYSPVTFPMNTRAQVDTVKADTDIKALLRGVIAKAAGITDDSQELQLLISQTKSVLNTLVSIDPLTHSVEQTQPVEDIEKIATELKEILQLHNLKQKISDRNIYND